VIKTRIVRTLCAAAALGVCFVLARYAFFGLHGMRQWPFVLFVFGLVVICVAGIADRLRVMLGVVAGYAVGFAAGMLFNSDVFHYYRGPYGSYTNNNFQIWTYVYLLFIFLGVAWEIARHMFLTRRAK